MVHVASFFVKSSTFPNVKRREKQNIKNLKTVLTIIMKSRVRERTTVYLSLSCRK